MSKREATVDRKTNETKIFCRLNLDGEGVVKITTGIGFLDHMLAALSKHAGFDIDLSCKGDLEVDDHHTAEDCALVIGAAIDEALGERKGIARFGHAYAPLDEALARAVVDLSGRPFCVANLDLRRDMIGDIAAENIAHALYSLATAARMTLHVDVIRGANDHHKAEGAFKALALALKQAVAKDGSSGVPSTKGAL